MITVTHLSVTCASGSGVTAKIKRSSSLVHSRAHPFHTWVMQALALSALTTNLLPCQSTMAAEASAAPPPRTAAPVAPPGACRCCSARRVMSDLKASSPAWPCGELLTPSEMVYERRGVKHTSRLWKFGFTPGSLRPAATASPWVRGCSSAPSGRCRT
jgi:hypothetical protein